MTRESLGHYVAERVSFDSGGSAVAGVLYRPVGDSVAGPCVVMAQGFSGTMDWIVPEFAATFADGGLTVLIFDYRYLGVSGGEPRQLIDTRRQREDLHRAIEFARSRKDIDTRRIALWGTSLGGSHAIQLAAEDTKIAAVVANAPGLDLFKGIKGRYVPPNMRMSKRKIAMASLRLFTVATLDAARGAVGLSPHYIPVYGRLGHAVFSDPALKDLFRNVERNAPSWRNRFTPRFFFTAPRYRDGTIERITAPLMVTLARDNEVTSTAFVKEKVANAIRRYFSGRRLPAAAGRAT